MTDGADRRLRAFKELRSMTAYTRIVGRIVRDVREVSDRLRIPGGNLVTGVTRTLMFRRGVQKLRIVSGG